jgi:peptidoglycan/xylan/chitin deacetylase (PgdA/CDA1 family)
MRFFRLPFFAGWLFPEALFRIRTKEKILCLTFDDGPDPDSTPFLLNILDKHQIKATFFCCGYAAEKYPDLIKLITSKGHLIGNHSYSHLKGWETPFGKYIEDVNRAAVSTSPVLFRPPYGQLTLKQDKTLMKTYKIVFWDLMPYDFDNQLGSKNSLNILKKKIRPGSVIVLHDSRKSIVNSFLGEFIDFSTSQGYRFVLP